MNKLTPITLLFLATTLGAQEVEQPSPDIDSTIDPIAAEVFADDLVAPDASSPESSTPELPPEPVHEAPTEEQTVPVANEEVLEEELPEEELPEEGLPEDKAEEIAEASDLMTVQLPPDATPEEELIYQYNRYLRLVEDGVYDEADSVAKRVVELAITVKGPQSSDFSRALTNLAIVQHRTGQFDAAQQNFQLAIEIIENNEDRLNAQLINPLKGLGTSQLEIGRPDLASATFRRAVHVSHVNSGPHNLNQIPILESLAETNLRLGSVKDARVNQDMIYALNERAFAANTIGMVPSLMRRAEWQLRAGFINDQRVSLRRVVRIIELEAGPSDLQLVEPLTLLGKSFFYLDVSGSSSAPTNVTVSGEIYFKRALRVASEHPEASWQMVAETSLALGDFYMYQGNEQRARKVYRESWQSLSEGEDRLAFRAEKLEQAVTLRQNEIPRYISPPSRDADLPLLEGTVTIAYEVSARGAATGLKIIEARPVEFTDVVRAVQREMRGRIYRPRFVEAEPVKTDNQVLIHRFFYQQADLDALREKTAATEPKTDQT